MSVHGPPTPDPKSPPRKVPKLHAGATPSSHTTPTQSRSKLSSAKKVKTEGGHAQTPPISARANRIGSPSGVAAEPAAASAPAPAAPVAAPAPAASQEPRLWITAPNNNPNGYVVFRPAHSSPLLVPSGYTLAGPPPPPPPPAPVVVAPPAPEQPEGGAIKSENSMDVSADPSAAPDANGTDSAETSDLKSSTMDDIQPAAPAPPAAPATPPPPPLPQVHPNLANLQKLYASGQPVHFQRGGSAMSPHMRQHPTCPGYTPLQAARCQNPYVETGTLGFSAHYKRHFAEPARHAQQGKVFIIDNGAYAVKMGFSSDPNPEVIHNMVGKPKAAKRKFAGAELGFVHGAYAPMATPVPKNGKAPAPTTNGPATLSKSEAANVCGDFRSLSITRPHDRGYVLNWDLQTQIWALDQVFRRKQTFVPPTTAKKGSGAASISSATAANAAPPSSGDPADIPDAESHCLILTEAHLSPRNLNQKLVEHIFTALSFGSLFVCSPAFLAMIQHRYAHSYTADNGRILISYGEGKEAADVKEGSTGSPPLPAPLQNPCCMLVEIGYSFSHATPFFDDFKLNYAIKRLNVGGKMLTNYLRELVSFRHFNMMDQTYLMSLVKERLCYVSKSVQTDLKTSRMRNNTIKKHYILPDQTNSILGFVYGTAPTAADLGAKAVAVRNAAMQVDGAAPSEKPVSAATDAVPEDAQVLTLTNERFAVPEMLFHPSDVQLKQAGLAEVIWQSIMAVPEYLREAFCANIVLTGASAAIPGLADRVMQELRPLLPTQYTLRIYAPSSPGTFAWHGGRYLATHRAEWLDSVAVSKAEFQESGMHIPKHRFALY